MYVHPNYKKKKDLREALERGEPVIVFQPGPFPSQAIGKPGIVSVEGPHYPEPHKWYARVTIDAEGRVTKVNS